MAILKAGVLGKPVKSSGEITFSKWRAHTVIKTKITTNESNSVKQIFQRAKFAFVSVWNTALSGDFIPRFWTQWRTPTTVANSAFMSYNIVRQPEYVNPETAFAGDASEIVISRGNLEPAPIISAIYTPGTGKLNVIWNTTISGNGENTDKVYCLVGIRSKGMFLAKENFERDGAEYEFDLPEGLASVADAISVWLFTFKGVVGSEIISMSQFLDASDAV